MPPLTALSESENSTRGRAYDALAALEPGIGRTGAVVRAQYLRARHCCFTHLRRRFTGRLTDAEMAEIVEHRLVAYLAPLLVRHVRRSRTGPAEMLSQLDNAALDRMSGTRPAPIHETTYWVDDSAVLVRAFGAGVDAAGYRFALRMARVLEERAEFLVATQYVDLLHTTGHADFAEVAGKLQFDEARVRTLWFSFVRRLPRRTVSS